VKLQKLLHEAEKRMMAAGLRAFSYVFYRWKHGAYSPEADWGLEWLEKGGLVKVTDREIATTAEGRKLLEDVKQLLDRNKKTLEIIDKVAEVHALDTGKTMKAIAYGTPVPELAKRIEDVEKGEVVLRPVDKSRASSLFLIDDREIETLEILLDKESRESLQEAMDDARHGRVTPFQPVG